MEIGPDKDKVFPNDNLKSVCYIKNVIKNKNIIVGDYTYYSDIKDATDFQSHVTHHYDFIGDKLIIGKFCQIAQGIEFIMNGANHIMNRVTTYPFSIFFNGWQKIDDGIEKLPLKGDTIVGNDVWFGQNVTVMPGVRIGNGAIIAANSVVTSNVAAYTVVGGNPARLIKKRFDDELISYLEKISWWDWDKEKIFENLEVLTSGDLQAIKLVK
ncbi:Acetyltransferase, putative VAT B [Alteracholeplasma palmae J233]|uniref:Acetyltransferase, putative VAT B n=1 Tax=Alteracholeplasma palmae (strain ATCC 49389 / J233) TaxID=1318466 RepID=U4KLJ0_ALTPJ|nr:Vat family streptogramin A O-acetyltransferase [Alteracholeplasma palmae]CCV64722.1 Acetyltransferase, putative VAT B [Alteracholeplasma palmae J233]